MNILVTGYEGFVGNALVGRLKNKNNLIIGLDKGKNSNTKIIHTPDIAIKGDVRDFELLRKIIVDYEIEEIYHFAAQAITKICSNDPHTTFNINAMGTATLLEVCRNWGENVKKIIISTSDKAFGNSPVPYNESSFLSPLFIYDTSKACQQLIALSYFNNYKLPIRIIACSNIYGPGDFNMSRVIPSAINRLLQERPARLWKHSTEHIREFIYIDDVLDAFLLVSEKGKNGEVYCCGGTEYLKIKDLIEKICIMMGKDPLEYIKIEERPLNLMELTEQYIDSRKLRSLGWIPKMSLDDGIKETIKFYKEIGGHNKLQTREEIIVKGADSFKDERGNIDNYYLPEPINWIGLIETIVKSEKNSLRGNHYHPEQEQKVLVVSGSYVSVYMDLTKKDTPIKYHLVQAGDLVITPPNIAHTQLFLEDCILLNLVSGERKHENYGKHTVYYELVKPEEIERYTRDFKEKLVNNTSNKTGFQENCRVCEGKNLRKVVSLGKTPLANSLLSKEELGKGEEELFPLELMYCEDCHLCQLSYVVPPEKMFKEYLYVSSTTNTTRKHFENMAQSIVSNFNLKSGSFIVDIGSNDGLLLKYFKERGMQVLGVEPAKNICEIARKDGIETKCDFINEKVVEEIIQEKSKADVITANNVFAHTGDIKNFTSSVKSLLKEEGIFVIEAQYIMDTIRGLTFDNIYHEHLSYFSILSLNEFFKRQDMKIFKVEYLNVHGGSIRVFVQKRNGIYQQDPSVNEFIEREKEFGLDKLSTYEKFEKSIQKKKEETKAAISRIKMNGNRIVGYGSPAKATTLLNFYGITNKELDYIIEDNPLKEDKIVPGVRIPIRNNILREPFPDYIYILAWNYAEEIIKNNSSYRDKGIKFLVSSPELRIL
jgi:nucleoside-diphosphate-sugar epimerase/dTDP-4-dehydrorhamnose 3,5-epimerase-like enzyme/SAM-dependent methyltransferase